ncbi:MAG: hypothetical protein PVF73_10660 [Bacteroidales bacterium]|jgi:hypothetical protein
MDSYLTNKTELDRYKKDQEIIRKTALQISKDFAQFGYEIIIPKNVHFVYSSLFDQLAPIVQDMLNENISRLYTVLYCIDLNEKTIQKGISEMNNLPVYDAITHLILERELKKVITREYFSTNQ